MAKAHNNIGLVFIERGKDYQELAINSFKTKVTNKDEIAFFPPVTGG